MKRHGHQPLGAKGHRRAFIASSQEGAESPASETRATYRDSAAEVEREGGSRRAGRAGNWKPCLAKARGATEEESAALKGAGAAGEVGCARGLRSRLGGDLAPLCKAGEGKEICCRAKRRVQTAASSRNFFPLPFQSFFKKILLLILKGLVLSFISGEHTCHKRLYIYIYCVIVYT